METDTVKSNLLGFSSFYLVQNNLKKLNKLAVAFAQVHWLLVPPTNSIQTLRTGCSFPNEFNANSAHSFTVPCTALSHLIYPDFFITQFCLNEDPVLDLVPAHMWVSHRHRTHTLDGTDFPQMLGHLRSFPCFARDSRGICLASHIFQLIRAFVEVIHH